MTQGKYKYIVHIIESELGWGSKVDEVKEFGSEEGAKAFVSDYNKKHNSDPIVPDWYMCAVYAGSVLCG